LYDQFLRKLGEKCICFIFIALRFQYIQLRVSSNAYAFNLTRRLRRDIYSAMKILIPVNSIFNVICNFVTLASFFYSKLQSYKVTKSVETMIIICDKKWNFVEQFWRESRWKCKCELEIYLFANLDLTFRNVYRNLT